MIHIRKLKGICLHKNLNQTALSDIQLALLKTAGDVTKQYWSSQFEPPFPKGSNRVKRLFAALKAEVSNVSSVSNANVSKVQDRKDTKDKKTGDVTTDVYIPTAELVPQKAELVPQKAELIPQKAELVSQTNEKETSQTSQKECGLTHPSTMQMPQILRQPNASYSQNANQKTANKKKAKKKEEAKKKEALVVVDREVSVQHKANRLVVNRSVETKLTQLLLLHCQLLGIIKNKTREANRREMNGQVYIRVVDGGEILKAFAVEARSDESEVKKVLEAAFALSVPTLKESEIVLAKTERDILIHNSERFNKWIPLTLRLIV